MYKMVNLFKSDILVIARAGWVKLNPWILQKQDLSTIIFEPITGKFKILPKLQLSRPLSGQEVGYRCGHLLSNKLEVFK